MRFGYRLQELHLSKVVSGYIMRCSAGNAGPRFMAANPYGMSLKCALLASSTFFGGMVKRNQQRRISSMHA